MDLEAGITVILVRSMLGLIKRFCQEFRIKISPLNPEGVLSNIPSIVNAMAGVFIGRMIKFQQNSAVRLMKNMVAAGIGAIIVGIVWGEYFPINKTLWTSSFVLVTVGISTLLLALFYWLIDVLKWQRWAVFFSIIGTNSIIAYLASAIIDFNYIGS